MKNILFLFLFCTAHFIFAQQDSYKSLQRNIDAFQEDSTYFIFGHNVKLREGASTDDEVVTLLAIGEQIEVLERTKETFHISGYDSHWFKVKSGEKMGYVVGALLAIQGIEIDNQRFLFNRNLEGLVIRALQKANTYVEQKIELHGSVAGVQAFGNRGLEGIKHVIYLDYQGECCGCEMGGSYFFYDGKRLIHAIDKFSSGDIGFSDSENIIFPADKKGLPSNKIIFQSNSSEVVDEVTNWEESHSTSRELVWRDGKFHPEDFRSGKQ